MTTSARSLSLLAIPLFLSAANFPAHAQGQSVGQNRAIEEIIVSARKTEENVQDIPIALQAISSQMIEERRIVGIEGIADLSAGLVFDSGLLPNDTRPVIRGLSSARGRANVATLIDDVDVTSESLTTGGGGMTANLRLMDLERVEIVKGPQSVLYGRSAFTGAVNYVTKRPSQEFGGEVSVDVDEYGTRDLKLSVTGGLTDKLAGKVLVSDWETDGWYENPNTGGDLGGGESTGASFSLEFISDGAFSAFTSLTMSDEEYRPRAIAFKSTMLNVDENGNAGTYETGIAAPGAEMFPYTFDQATIDFCQTDAARNVPFAENLENLSPALTGFFPGTGNCRPLLVGELKAKESDVDYSVDPRTGRDFRGSEVETTHLHVDLRWEYDDYEIRSITGYTDNEVNIQEDFDLTDYSLISNTPFDFMTFMGNPLSAGNINAQYGLSAASDITHSLEQISQEFRFIASTDNVDWFLSALIWQEDMNTDWDDVFWLRDGGDDFSGITGGFPLFTATPVYTIPTTEISRETRHWSVAGSLSWAFEEDFSLTIEGRYLDEKIDYKGTNEDRGAITATAGFACDFGAAFDPGNIPPDLTADAPCGDSSNSADSSKFVPRVSLDWQATVDALVYLTYAEGYKPGGVATIDANGDVSDGEFDPEELVSYELGAKTSWLDNSLFINGAIFLYDYTDQQVGITSVLNGIAQSQTVNAGKSSLEGFELDISWRPTANTSVDFGYVYADAEYDDFNLAEIAASSGGNPPSSNNVANAGNADADFSGKKLPLSARNAATLGLRYEQPVFNNLDGFAEIFGSYQSKRYIDDGNLAYLPSYSIWNLSVGVSDDDWRAIVYVDNLLDDDTIRSGIGNTDYGLLPDYTGTGGLPKAANLILPQPRTVGLRLSYSF